MKRVNVLIVGAGPSGLLTAIYLHRYGFNPFLVDIRKDYTRRQIVTLDFWTTEMFLPNEVMTALRKDGCYVDSPNYLFGHACYSKPLIIKHPEFPYSYRITSFAININLVEAALRKHVQKLKIPIIIDPAYKLDTTKGQIKFSSNGKIYNFQYLIGADSYNSYIREHVFADSGIYLYPPDTNFVASFSFKQRKRIKAYNTLAPGQHMPQDMNNRIRTFAIKNGSITFSVSLSESEYQSLGSGFESSPIVTKILKQYFPLYGYNYNEMRDSFISLTKVPINVRRARQFYKRIGKVDCFLIGDAAYSVHFFSGTGINSGFAHAYFLANAMRYHQKWPNTYIYFNSVMKQGSLSAFTNSRFAFLDHKLVNERCTDMEAVNSWLSEMNIPTRGLSNIEKCYLAGVYLDYIKVNDNNDKIYINPGIVILAHNWEFWEHLRDYKKIKSLKKLVDIINRNDTDMNIDEPYYQEIRDVIDLLNKHRIDLLKIANNSARVREFARIRKEAGIWEEAEPWSYMTVYYRYEEGIKGLVKKAITGFKFASKWNDRQSIFIPLIVKANERPGPKYLYNFYFIAQFYFNKSYKPLKK